MAGSRGGRTLVVGDIHGAARALVQVFERAGFDPDRDRLISLGDLCDGWPEVDRCVDLLLPVADLTVILGNHDEWAAAWMRGEPALGWWGQGGAATVESYARRAGLASPGSPAEAAEVARRVPAEHLAMLRDARPYHIETGDDGLRRLFAHAGWNPGRPPAAQNPYDLRLGRELWTQARILEQVPENGPEGGPEDGPEDGPEGRPEQAPRRRITAFDEVFIGHTPTRWREPRPLFEIWNLDQGAGWDGVLTLMDVHSHEFWQSDPVPELYPGVQGRG